MGRAFSTAFSDALATHSMSLSALHRALSARGVKVSLTTLSYWRSGQREPEHEPSLRAVATIEQILALPPGTLESLIERRRSRISPGLLADLSEDHERIRSLLADLRFDSPSDRLIDREVTLKYVVGRDRSPARLTYTMVVEALQTEAHRRAFILRVRPGAATPAIRPLAGFELGEVIHDRKHGIVVGEMLLDRPLSPGETALLEQEVVYRTPDSEDNHYFYWAVRRMTSVTLWIRFDQDELPARCEFYTILDGAEQVVELDTFGPSVSRTVNGFGPGTLGIRWHWE